MPSRGGSYWKFKDAARFELWAIDRSGRRTTLVRTGPKLDYCLRDLDRVRGGPDRPAHALLRGLQPARAARAR